MSSAANAITIKTFKLYLYGIEMNEWWGENTSDIIVQIVPLWN